MFSPPFLISRPPPSPRRSHAMRLVTSNAASAPSTSWGWRGWRWWRCLKRLGRRPRSGRRRVVGARVPEVDLGVGQILRRIQARLVWLLVYRPDRLLVRERVGVRQLDDVAD